MISNPLIDLSNINTQIENIESEIDQIQNSIDSLSEISLSAAGTINTPADIPIGDTTKRVKFIKFEAGGELQSLIQTTGEITGDYYGMVFCHFDSSNILQYGNMLMVSPRHGCAYIVGIWSYSFDYITRLAYV